MKSLILATIASALALPVTLAQTNPAPTPPPASAPVDLPVTKVVLFSSGVGYFEHTGEVQNDAVMRLMFKTEQINDVLKSMILMDFSGGQVASVTYGANEPVARALRSFGVDISGNPTLPQLLGQLRGAKVVVTVPERVTGSILNVDSRVKIVGQPPTQTTEYVLNLVTETGIRAIPLDSMSSLQLSDAKLQDELNQALALLVSARDTDRKPVEVRFVGNGTRKILASYLVETPVWKTSYRLDLGSQKPTLQGWAIVENTSESDWKDVELSLTSGRPISFTQDLYTPLYVRRPVVVPERYASLSPRIYDEGIAANAGGQFDQLRASTASAALGAAGGGAGGRGAGGGRGGGGAGGGGGLVGAGGFGGGAASASAPSLASADLAQPRFQLASGVQAMAAGAEVGELFRFTLTTPLNLARRRSAMIPILNQEIAAEKVSIYNQSVLSGNPLNGAFVTNTTKLKLLGGPVTVLDGGAYAGDAQFDHMEKGEKRFISYAVDLAVNVDPSITSASRISSAFITRGVLNINRLQTWTQTYRMQNKSEADRKIIVEHPFNATRKLVEPATFEEKTETVYRFRVPIKAGAKGDFVVRQEQTDREEVRMLDVDVTAFSWAISNDQIPSGVKKALQKAIDMKNVITEAQRQLDELYRQAAEIKASQARFRDNIATAGRDTPQGQTWLKTLAQQENDIEALEGKPGMADTGKIDAANDNLLKKRKELDDYLAGLSVDAPK